MVEVSVAHGWSEVRDDSHDWLVSGCGKRLAGLQLGWLHGPVHCRARGEQGERWARIGLGNGGLGPLGDR